MLISVVNHAHGQLEDELVLHAIRAINRQIAEDFEPSWGRGAKLRLESRMDRKPTKGGDSEVRGDAIIYLWNEVNLGDALGYHDENHRGIPYGFIFPALCAEWHKSWSAMLSHESLELVADPEANLLVSGPHPKEDREVYHWVEACDAVQAETYELDRIEVSNFLLPAYFTLHKHGAARCDFLGRAHEGHTLRPFGVKPGGYIGFFDPKKKDQVMYPADEKAASLLELRGERASRHRRRRGSRHVST